MDVLSVLENKIANLIELVKSLNDEKAKLVTENAELKEKLEMLENSMLQGNEDIEKLNQEKAITKMVVDDLIKDIDSIVGK